MNFTEEKDVMMQILKYIPVKDIFSFLSQNTAYRRLLSSDNFMDGLEIIFNITVPKPQPRWKRFVQFEASNPDDQLKIIVDHCDTIAFVSFLNALPASPPNYFHCGNFRQIPSIRDRVLIHGFDYAVRQRCVSIAIEIVKNITCIDLMTERMDSVICAKSTRLLNVVIQLVGTDDLTQWFNPAIRAVSTDAVICLIENGLDPMYAIEECIKCNRGQMGFKLIEYCRNIPDKIDHKKLFPIVLKTSYAALFIDIWYDKQYVKKFASVIMNIDGAKMVGRILRIACDYPKVAYQLIKHLDAPALEIMMCAAHNKGKSDIVDRISPLLVS